MNLDQYFTYGFNIFLIVLLVVTILCTIIWKSIDNKLRKYNEANPSHAVSVQFVSAAVRAADFLIGLLIVLHHIIPLQSMVDTILGASGVLALCSTVAARESIGNYISGFLLTVHKPFQSGDYVILKKLDVEGTVKEITFRHTIIETKEGNLVTVPNSNMNTAVVEIIADSDGISNKQQAEGETEIPVSTGRPSE